VRMHTMRVSCRDLQESENYYTNILGLNKLFGSTAAGFVGYELDNVNLMIEPQELGEFECGNFLGFSLIVEDINEFYRERLKKGAEFTGPPEMQVWGGIMTHLKDCSGNTFSIVQIDDDDNPEKTVVSMM